jgi:hypothetical protein
MVGHLLEHRRRFAPAVVDTAVAGIVVFDCTGIRMENTYRHGESK